MKVKSLGIKGGGILAVIALVAPLGLTQAGAMTFQDRLIIKDSDNQVIRDFMVSSGTNHRVAAAEELGVEVNTIEWLSGDTEWDRDYQYEAVMLASEYDSSAGEDDDSEQDTGNTTAQDRLIVKNQDNQVLEDFRVESGINHRQAVADRMDTALESVEWVSGDTEFNREYQYQAILLVR